MKEVLFRDAGMSDALGGTLGLYRRIDRFFERLHMGVTLVSVGRKQESKRQ
jgi:hypothetical protein